MSITHDPAPVAALSDDPTKAVSKSEYLDPHVVTVADAPYAPGSFTIADGRYAVVSGRIELGATDVGTIDGDGSMLIDGV